MARRPDPQSHIMLTCKMGQGKECCRYLAFGPDGFECIKHTEHRAYIDERVLKGTMVAQGDNCAGLSDLYALATSS